MYTDWLRFRTDDRQQKYVARRRKKSKEKGIRNEKGKEESLGGREFRSGDFRKRLHKRERI